MLVSSRKKLSEDKNDPNGNYEVYDRLSLLRKVVKFAFKIWYLHFFQLIIYYTYIIYICKKHKRQILYFTLNKGWHFNSRGLKLNISN